MEVKMAEQNNQEVKEGEGTVEMKQEALTKNNDPYWKFKIDGKSYSLFEHEAGSGISVGDYVGMYWTETQKGNITYRNLNSIFKKEIHEEKVSNESKQEVSQPQQPQAPQKDMKKVQEYKAKEADSYELGMAKNNATILFGEILRSFSSAEEKQAFIKDNGDMWDNLATSLFNRGKKIREQILGY